MPEKRVNFPTKRESKGHFSESEKNFLNIVSWTEERKKKNLKTIGKTFWHVPFAAQAPGENGKTHKIEMWDSLTAMCVRRGYENQEANGIEKKEERRKKFYQTPHYAPKN